MSSHNNPPAQQIDPIDPAFITPIDPAFITPKKVRGLADSFHPYLTPYCPSKLKEIAQKIRSNANKRFKVREEGGEMRLIFWSEMKQVSESTDHKQSPISWQGQLTQDQLEQLVKMKRLAVNRAQENCIQKRKQVQDSLKHWKDLTTKKKMLSQQLKSLRKTNKVKQAQIAYCKFLKKINQRQEQIHNNLQAEIVDAHKQYIKVSNCISEIPILDQQIAEKRMILDSINKQMKRCELQEQRLIDEASPHSMINCLFLVGILKEQTYILIMQKAERGKQGQTDKVGNRALKIAQKMGRRTVVIECQNSVTVELRTFIAIYMHCRSLILPNIVTLMNSLSFFSPEFKEIYNFSAFEMSVRSLIIVQDSKDKVKNEIVCLNETQTLKKRLIIIVKREHQAFLRSILRLFEQFGDDYCISLNQMKMIVKVWAEDEKTSNLDIKDLPNPDHNELRLQFNNMSYPA